MCRAQVTFPVYLFLIMLLYSVINGDLITGEGELIVSFLPSR